MRRDYTAVAAVICQKANAFCDENLSHRRQWKQGEERTLHMVEAVLGIFGTSWLCRTIGVRQHHDSHLAVDRRCVENLAVAEEHKSYRQKTDKYTQPTPARLSALDAVLTFCHLAEKTCSTHNRFLSISPLGGFDLHQPSQDGFWSAWDNSLRHDRFKSQRPLSLCARPHRSLSSWHSPRRGKVSTNFLIDLPVAERSRVFVNCSSPEGVRSLSWVVCQEEYDTMENRAMAAAAALAFFLVLLTTTFHYGVLQWISGSMSRSTARTTRRVLCIVFVVILAHLVEITLYAISYLLSAEVLGIGSFGGPFLRESIDYLYFSIVTYTSLGLGDVFPRGHLRFIAGMEALNGLLLIAWSASFIYLAMGRFWPWEHCAELDRTSE